MLNLADTHRVAKSFRGKSYYRSCVEASLLCTGVFWRGTVYSLSWTSGPLGAFPLCRWASPSAERGLEGAGSALRYKAGCWIQPTISSLELSRTQNVLNATLPGDRCSDTGCHWSSCEAGGDQGNFMDQWHLRYGPKARGKVGILDQMHGAHPWAKPSWCHR